MGRDRNANGPANHVGMTGSVVRVVIERGYAFIRGEDGRDYFCHRMDAQKFDDFQPGLAVRFVPREAVKGPRAENVIRA